MGKYNLIEEKGLCNYNHRFMDSLEEKVSVFLDEESDKASFACDNDDDDDWDEFDESGNNSNFHNSMERTLFWESQEALLQVLSISFLGYFPFYVLH